jgi:hypothetical protein
LGKKGRWAPIGGRKTKVEETKTKKRETVRVQAKRMKLSISKVRKLRQGTYTLTQEEKRVARGEGGGE